jgi:peptidyl-prolyl cis-trans isomerase A (cyclophilin A)
MASMTSGRDRTLENSLKHNPVIVHMHFIVSRRVRPPIREIVALAVITFLPMLGGCGHAGDSNQSGGDTDSISTPLLSLKILEPPLATETGARTAALAESTLGIQQQTNATTLVGVPTYGAAEVLSTLKAAHGRNSNPVPYYLDTNGDGVVTRDDAQRVLGWALKGLQRPNVAPLITQVPDLVLVANRPMTPAGISVLDPDDALLNYSVAGYSDSDLRLREFLGWPHASPLADFGLTLNNATGVISGIPVLNPLSKSYITVIVADRYGASSSKRFSLQLLTDSLNTHFRSANDGALSNEVQFTAADTSRGGTVAYCVTTNPKRPEPTNSCFRTDAEGGRTVSVPITPTNKIPQHYLFTKNASDDVLGGTIPTAGDKPLVLIDTDKGPFLVELEHEKAKITTDNFLKYVEDGFFAGTVFHRVISNFIVQGGGWVYDRANPTKYAPQTAGGGLRAPIVLEKTSDTNLSNTKGTIAMARTSVPNSATSQFFINVVDNSGALDSGTFESNGYAIFGRIIPPVGGAPGDLPNAVRDIMAVPVSGSMGGTGQIAPSIEQSAPVGRPPTITSARRLN